LTLLVLALAASISAGVDWLSPPASSGQGFVLFGRGPGWASPLTWDGLRPPLPLRALVAVGAWSLVVLSLRRPALAARLSLPMAAGTCHPHSSRIAGRTFAAPGASSLGLIVGPGFGMWASLTCLLLAAALTVSSFRTSSQR
jgi:hypothetical protein